MVYDTSSSVKLGQIYMEGETEMEPEDAGTETFQIETKYRRDLVLSTECRVSSGPGIFFHFESTKQPIAVRTDMPH